MAKLMNPLMSSEARGRVGGTVYNTWRGIRYAKQQTSPAQPRSALQLQIRAWMVYLVRLWQTIGSTKMGHWNDYAVAHPDVDWTNRSRRLTGLNWYCRCNTRLLLLAKPIIDEPPSIPAPNPLEAFAAANGVAQSILTWTATADWGDYVDINILGPISAGVSPKMERSRHQVFAQGPSATVTITDLSPGTYAFWGRVIYHDNGLASPWVLATALVT